MTEKLESRNVLITGATGYIGANITSRLVENGWNVHVIVRPDSKVHLLKSVNHAIHMHIYDGSTERLIQIVHSANPSIVLHLASFATVAYEPKDILPMIKSNILFGTQLVEAMVANEVYHLINTGTYSQHFEDAPYNPQSIYAATKQAFEDILVYYSETTPLKLLTLTLFDSYGPHDPRQKIIPLLLKTMREKKALQMTPGEQVIDLVYIDDIVDAYLLAMHRMTEEESGKTEKFAVSSQRHIRLRDVVSIFEKVTNCTLPITWGGQPYRKREAMIPWTKGVPLPGWKPKISFEEGIAKIVTIEGDNYDFLYGFDV
ncbi:NAD-dependent epimerase/dehydratase family protein [Brevibacillus sp. SYSU BS000544]|uniref:NAD-dependent epimerase/dehydratase family protein n=1 Tax=Brevibacillus sp. SYSU BS000544 TaxID=3416443 RepID=UPI003CE4B647